jgi:hypothetical protein
MEDRLSAFQPESSIMKPERPVVVLVFAILNLVFGGLAILGYFCGGLALIFVFAVFSSAPSGPSFPPLPSGLVTLFVVIFLYGFIMAIALILSGIGLLNMKPWARKTAIVYSIITIVYAIVALVLNITYVGPVMQKWQDELQEQITRDQQRRGLPPPPAMYQPNQSPWVNVASSIVGAMLQMGYAIALLIVMYLPYVTAAFGGRTITRRTDWDRDPEYESQG